MSGKNQYYSVYNWQSAYPITNFIPNPYPGGSVPSGIVNGTMSGTNTIYTNILDVAKMDSIGLEVNWTGTPVGNLQVMGSNSGFFAYSLTFTPPLAQPTGAAGGYLIDLSMYPFKYLFLQYTNTSGAGTISSYLQLKDLN